ncbi:MAG: hydrolase, partial [Chloroflexi bacterium]|nr:hydrolase [Chloroflexota bacterium]
RYHPHLALVNIGGYYTMDPVDAAYACREYLKPEWVVPMHYPGPMNTMTSNDLAEFRRLMRGSGIQVVGMKSGDTVRF